MQSERDAEQEIEFYSWQTQYGHEEAIRIAAEEWGTSETQVKTQNTSMGGQIMAVNYTEAQVKYMVAEYSANPTRETVENLADELEKSVKSIIGKLSREGVYKKDRIYYQNR